jgi:hypothetical protein
MWQVIENAAEDLIKVAGLKRHDSVDVSLPRLGAAWSITGMAAIQFQLGDQWPACADQLTPEIRYGVERTANLYGVEARGKFEKRRIELNNRMAEIFSELRRATLMWRSTLRGHCLTLSAALLPARATTEC